MQACILLIEGWSSLKSILSDEPKNNLFFFYRNNLSIGLLSLITTRATEGCSFRLASSPWSETHFYQSIPFLIYSLTPISIFPKTFDPFPSMTPQKCSFSPPLLKVFTNGLGWVAANLPASSLLLLNLSRTNLSMTLSLR